MDSFTKIPLMFLVVESIYDKTDLFLGMNYNKTLFIVEVYKSMMEKYNTGSYAYIFRVMVWLKNNKYITMNKKGKYMYIELTDKGVQLAKMIHPLLLELQKS